MRILIKGAGDLASGIACRLYACGYEIIMTELPQPTTIRRAVAFSNAIYEGSMTVEGIKAGVASDKKELEGLLKAKQIAVVADPAGGRQDWYQAGVVVDAVMAKYNTGTTITAAKLVIGVGPGFAAGQDCHYVIETKRGHQLGQVIYSGSAIPNTGVPGNISGYTAERLIRAGTEGIFKAAVQIGDFVEAGAIVARSGDVPIKAQISGIVRGILKSGLRVMPGMKCGDIDPRCEREHCFTVSDKARSVGGGVLEAILHHTNFLNKSVE